MEENSEKANVLNKTEKSARRRRRRRRMGRDRLGLCVDLNE